MKLLTMLICAPCLLFTGVMMAQNDPSSSYLVTLYQLSYKPAKSAHKLFEDGAKSIKQHDYQAGVTLLQQALKEDPNFWLAANDLGFAYIQLFDHAKAAEAFQRAIDIDPENAVGYANLGVAAADLLDFKLAEQCGHRALELNPLLPQAKLLLGVVAICQGHWTPEARKMFEDVESFIPIARQILQEWPEHPSRAAQAEVLRTALH